MLNLDVFDNLGPFWAHLDTFGSFQTKTNFLPDEDKEGFGGGAFEKKGPKLSKTSRFTFLDLLGLFWTTLEC